MKDDDAFDSVNSSFEELNPPYVEFVRRPMPDTMSDWVLRS
jgi:hypothetical protein